MVIRFWDLWLRFKQHVVQFWSEPLSSKEVVPAESTQWIIQCCWDRSFTVEFLQCSVLKTPKTSTQLVHPYTGNWDSFLNVADQAEQLQMCAMTEPRLFPRVGSQRTKKQQRERERSKLMENKKVTCKHCLTMVWARQSARSSAW